MLEIRISSAHLREPVDHILHQVEPIQAVRPALRFAASSLCEVRVPHLTQRTVRHVQR